MYSSMATHRVLRSLQKYPLLFTLHTLATTIYKFNLLYISILYIWHLHREREFIIIFYTSSTSST